MKSFFCALGFLTRLPVPARYRFEAVDLGRSMAAFPLVGFLLGVILVIADRLLSSFLPDGLTNILLLTLLALMTGGLHIDGFMDTLDGLAGGKDRESILEIMRDSRVGALGVVGIVLLLLIKWEALNVLPPEMKQGALLVMPVAGRGGQVLLAYLSPYARSEGLGRPFVGSLTGGGLAVALLSTVVIAAWAVGWYGIFIVIMTSLLTWLWSGWFVKRIGGVTGDVIGALNEVLEVMVLLVLVALI